MFADADAAAAGFAGALCCWLRMANFFQGLGFACVDELITLRRQDDPAVDPSSLN